MTEPHESSPSPRRRADGPDRSRRRARAPTCDAGSPSTPKELPPKWFYDDRGCELFDAITRLPEYYPTERERAILRAEAAVDRRGVRRRHAGRARLGHVGQDPRAARRRWPRRGQLSRASCPSRSARRRCAPRPRPSATSTPASTSTPWSATSSATSATSPAAARRLIAFLGGTIGNFAPAERKRFLADLADGMSAGRPLPARHRSGQGRRPARGRLRRRAGRDRRVQPQRAARGQPRARRRLRRRRGSPTWPASTATTSGSRCGCGRWPTRRCTIGALHLDVDVRRGRGDAHRDQRQVPPTRHRGRAGRRRPAPRALDDRSRRRLRPQPVGARVALAHRGATPRLHASISAYPSGRCSTSALMRSRVVRMPLRLVLPRAHPSSAQ